MPSMSMLLSSSVCQGLHPWKLKRTPIHRMWVLPSSTRLGDRVTSKKAKEEMDGTGGGGEGGWSSIYSSLSGTSKSPVKAVDMTSSMITKTSPVPPAITKRAILGKKSLAMCTETLGCETGAVYPVGDDEFDADTENGHSSTTGRPKEGMVAMRRKRGSKRAGFPPPLTTLSGESSRRILSKRENGRLRLLLVEPISVIEAERTDGRLRLRLYSEKPFHYSNGKQVLLERLEINKELMKEEGEKREKKEEEEEEEEEEGGYLGVVGMEMNEMMTYGCINGGEEMEIGRLRRPGGCKEEEGGGHGGHSKVMLNWEAEALWVASS